MVAGAIGAGEGGGAGRAGFAPISDAKSTATPLRVTVSAKLCRDAARARAALSGAPRCGAVRPLGAPDGRTTYGPADCRIASRLSYCQPILLFPRPRLSPGSRKPGAAAQGGAGRGGAAPSTRRRTWRSYRARTAAPAAPAANQTTEANDLITRPRDLITRQVNQRRPEKMFWAHQPAGQPVRRRAAAPSGWHGGRAGRKAGPPRP
jgi:hypothetical protein